MRCGTSGTAGGWRGARPSSSCGAGRWAGCTPSCRPPTTVMRGGDPTASWPAGGTSPRRTSAPERTASRSTPGSSGPTTTTPTCRRTTAGCSPAASSSSTTAGRRTCRHRSSTPTSASATGACDMARPFRFGVQSYAPAPAQEWRDQARRAENLGFSTFSVADHVIGPGPALAATNHPVQTVAVIPAMAVAAEATSTIRIGSRVLCVDYRQPVMLAKEAATLDFFSDGRLELGLGCGWLQGEYEAMGVDFDPAGVSLERVEEIIGLLRGSL